MTKQKILFLASSAPRYKDDPTSPFILNMAQDLCDLGWDVDILVPHAQGLKKKENIGSVSIYRFQYMFPSALQTLCYNGGVTENLKKSMANYFLIPFYLLSQIISAFILVKKNNYVLIHSHWIIPQGFIGNLISKIFKLPHIVYIHGGDIYGFKGKLFLFIKKIILKNSSAVIANSTHTANEVRRIYNHIKLSIIPTGTTPAKKPNFSIIKHSSSPLKIIFIGRLVPQKGLIYLLQSIQQIKNSVDVHLTVLGDGPEKNEYDDFIIKNDLAQNITFKGNVPHKDIYKYLYASDIFVGPSIQTKEWTEAQGNTFVEAMFSGTPVIASDIGGISDSVIHGKTGLLVPEKSSEDITQAVFRLIKNPEMQKKISENAYEHVLNNFSRYTSAKKISKIYHACIIDSQRH